MDGRGAVEYAFNLPSADVYKLHLEGTQGQTNSVRNDFNLLLSVDGQSLGYQVLTAAYGTLGMVECLTPYLPAGPHTLRILWDNPSPKTSLRLKSVHLQTGLGPDTDGNGMKDWVTQVVHAQSGMDLTNGVISSYTSPMCVEGRDPYLSLLQLNVVSGDNSTRR